MSSTSPRRAAAVRRRNAIWGNHTCVLAGDWLYMQAFQVALRERNFHVLDVLISLTQMMVEGELLQLERIGKIDVSEADYMELVDRKTASLFSACARLGAMMGGADEGTETRLGEFAWNLGIAFQLVDDVLDFTSREKVLGKPVGSDLREGKVTLPLIYALTEATRGRARNGGYGAQRRELRPGAVSRRFSSFIERRRGFERARANGRSTSLRRRAASSPSFRIRPISARCARSPNWSPTATISHATYLLKRPTRIPVPGNKQIDEYIGQVNTGTAAVSVAHMRSPSGWSEPGPAPEFDEYTVVLKRHAARGASRAA